MSLPLTLPTPSTSTRAAGSSARRLTAVPSTPRSTTSRTAPRTATVRHISARPRFTEAQGPEATDELLERIAKTRSAALRHRLEEQVIALNLPLADGIASRYAGRGIEKEDLVQVARMGLVKAVRGYQAGKGPGFRAYATPTVLGEIKRHFRDCGWTVRPPRRIQELQSEIHARRADLQQDLGRTPTTEDLATAMGVGEDAVRDALRADHAFAALSLDAPVRDETGSSLGELIADEGDCFGLIDDLTSLRTAIATLDDRDRKILALRFVGELTQEEIGKEVGVSQMQVSRLLTSILGRLREALENDPHETPAAALAASA